MDEPVDQSAGLRLKQFREKWNLSGRKFALRAGVDVSQYAKVEGGQVGISEKMLGKILATYPELTREYVMEGKEVSNKLKAGLLKNGNDPEGFISVANTILQLLPPVNESTDPGEQVRIYMEREEKYIMAIEVLTAALIVADLKVNERS